MRHDQTYWTWLLTTSTIFLGAGILFVVVMVYTVAEIWRALFG